jgi:alpha-tubulin suppressor-like RCC1 family protein
MALTKDGALFGWGYSETGRLGEMGQSTQTSSPQQYIGKSGDKYSSSVLEAVEKMVAKKIRSEDNMPIIWEPSLVHEATHLEVSDVSCGLDHSLILCCEYFVSLAILKLLCALAADNVFLVPSLSLSLSS